MKFSILALVEGHLDAAAAVMVGNVSQGGSDAAPHHQRWYPRWSGWLWTLGTSSQAPTTHSRPHPTTLPHAGSTHRTHASYKELVQRPLGSFLLQIPPDKDQASPCTQTGAAAHPHPRSGCFFTGLGPRFFVHLSVCEMFPSGEKEINFLPLN